MDANSLIDCGIIAALITFGSSQLVSIREGKLQHITGEREKWRDAIRKIAEDITIIDRVEGIKVQISKLKVRLNTYGFGTESELAWDKDGHIWKSIHMIEAKISATEGFIVGNELRRELDKLVDYLSLLLKDDWQRAKKEILDEKKELKGLSFRYIIMGIVTFIITLLVIKTIDNKFIPGKWCCVGWIILLLLCIDIALSVFLMIMCNRNKKKCNDIKREENYKTTLLQINNYYKEN